MHRGIIIDSGNIPEIGAGVNKKAGKLAGFSEVSAVLQSIVSEYLSWRERKLFMLWIKSENPSARDRGDQFRFRASGEMAPPVVGFDLA